MSLRALDLFAGHGWGVAARSLDIQEHAVEIMKEANETRALNGLSAPVFTDVWDGLLDEDVQVPEHELQIASPPCQTFSLAGKGAGRKALDDVLRAMREKLYRDPQALYGLTAALDPRTALVLSPLAYAYRYRPTYIVWEQVPTVRPVWEASADLLQMGGYSTWTGLLNAEQYGVPQTRKRAVLIARRDGIEAAPPTPTHSRFYSHDKARRDPGVPSFVTMADALGWGMTDRPYPTVATGTESGGGTDPAALGGSGARRLVYAERSDGAWAPSGDPDNDSGILRLSVDQAGALQTYPTRAIKRMGAGMVERHGDRSPREVDDPAFTIRASAGGMEPGGFVFQMADGSTRKMSPEEAAILQTYPTHAVAGDQSSLDWVFERPSPTIVGSFCPDVVAAPGYRKAGDGPRQNAPGSVRITEAQAALLQSYPGGFKFAGARGKQFLQIGNAVPPLLARAILAEFVA